MDDKITVIVVNIEFHNTVVLKVFAWILLVWYLIRFRHTREQTWKQYFLHDFEKEKDNRLLGWYLKPRIAPLCSPENEVTITGVRYVNHDFEITYNELTDSNKGKDGQGPNLRRVHAGNKIYKPSIKSKILIIVGTFFAAGVNRTGFAEQILPYLLFYFAALLGLGNLLLSSINGIR